MSIVRRWVVTDDITKKLWNISYARGDVSGRAIRLVCAEAAREIKRLRDELKAVQDGR